MQKAVVLHRLHFPFPMLLAVGKMCFQALRKASEPRACVSTTYESSWVPQSYK